MNLFFLIFKKWIDLRRLLVLKQVPRFHSLTLMKRNLSSQNLGSEEKRTKMAIVLTENERELCQLLRNVVQERNLKSTMRIAGGWVRDKVILL